MKKTTLILILIAILAGCGQKSKKAENTTIIDTTNVNVFYFQTCVAVQDVAKETVEKNFANNEKVRFIEINTSEKGNEALAEKYEVSWNALIIAKGENAVEITDQAFATAVENPQSLEKLITDEINRHLQ